jgi:hypothetical protein
MFELQIQLGKGTLTIKNLIESETCGVSPCRYVFPKIFWKLGYPISVVKLYILGDNGFYYFIGTLHLYIGLWMVR